MINLIRVLLGMTFSFALLASVALAGVPSEPSIQPENGLESSNQEGVPLSLNRHNLFSTKFLDKEYPEEWMELKEGESRILSDSNQVEKFYGTRKAKGILEFTDFDQQVFVVVVSELLDTCKRAGVVGLERMQDNRLKVTIEKLLDKNCQVVPGKERYQVIGMPIERPVESVEVIYMSKMNE